MSGLKHELFQSLDINAFKFACKWIVLDRPSRPNGRVFSNMPARPEDIKKLKDLGLLSRSRADEQQHPGPSAAIPNVYLPSAISQDLANELFRLKADMEDRGIPLEKLWLARDEGGILEPLMHTQLEYSTKSTPHLRRQIVQEAQKRLRSVPMTPAPVPPEDQGRDMSVVKKTVIVGVLFSILYLPSALQAWWREVWRYE